MPRSSRGWTSIHAVNWLISSAPSVSVGAATGSATTSAIGASRGKNATSETEATSQIIARVAATGLLTTMLTSRPTHSGSVINPDAAATETTNRPITATYIVMQSGHIWRRMKNEA